MYVASKTLTNTHDNLEQNFSPEELQTIENFAASYSRSNNHYIYYSGDNANMVYFLQKGRVKILSRSSDEKEIIKEIIYPGQMFGEECLAGAHSRSDFSLTMDKDVRYIAINLPSIRRIIKEQPIIGLKIITQMGQKLRTMERRLESVIFKNSRTRIIDFLKEKASEKGIPVGFEILLKHRLTHQDIANLTSTSRQTVTTVLNDLKKKNLIHTYRRNILIRDMGSLK